MASLSKKAGGGGNRIHTARTQADLILGKTGARVSQEGISLFLFFFFLIICSYSPYVAYFLLCSKKPGKEKQSSLITILKCGLIDSDGPILGYVLIFGINHCRQARRGNGRLIRLQDWQLPLLEGLFTKRWETSY